MTVCAEQTGVPLAGEQVAGVFTAQIEVVLDEADRRHPVRIVVLGGVGEGILLLGPPAHERNGAETDVNCPSAVQTLKQACTASPSSPLPSLSDFQWPSLLASSPLPSTPAPVPRWLLETNQPLRCWYGLRPLWDRWTSQFFKTDPPCLLLRTRSTHHSIFHHAEKIGQGGGEASQTALY